MKEIISIFLFSRTESFLKVSGITTVYLRVALKSKSLDAKCYICEIAVYQPL